MQMAERLVRLGADDVIVKSMGGARKVIALLEKAALEARQRAAVDINRAELARVALRDARTTIESLPPSDRETRLLLAKLARQVEDLIQADQQQAEALDTARREAMTAAAAAKVLESQVSTNTAKLSELSPGEKRKALGAAGLIAVLSPVIVELVGKLIPLLVGSG